MADTAHSSRRAAARPSVTRFGREIAAMTVLFLCYWFGRSLASADVSVAFDNAQLIWQLERNIHLPSELAAQNTMLAVGGLIEFANSYYALVHFPATAAFLVWTYLRRPQLYPQVRRAIVTLTALALGLHLVFPLAPPRMLNDLGFIDTGALYGPSVYPPPASNEVINQYAAMPSLHVGWSILVAAGLIAAFRTRWRWLWLLHPTVTTMVVIGTANHFWLDGIVACALLTTATLVSARVRMPSAPRRFVTAVVARAGRPSPAATPVEAGPVETAPVETAPAETAPAETAPAETARPETARPEAPVEARPVDGTGTWG